MMTRGFQMARPQKGMNGLQANGAANHPRAVSKPTPTAAGAAAAAAASPKETNTPDRHANDRLLFLLANCLGHSATITVKNGDGFEGIFSGSSFDPSESSWLLKMVRQTAVGSDRQMNGIDKAGSGYVGTGPEHAMRFEMKDVVDLAIGGVTFVDPPSRGPNGISSASSFRTDADISGNLAVRERTLQRWEPSADSDMDLSLEGPSNIKPGASRSNTAWDQFEVNERLYGLKSDYDENLYTTVIDRSDPLYKQRSAAAEKIAKEIEASMAMNAHVAEERGLTVPDDSGVNEEEKYSGVVREKPESSLPQSAQPNRYTPPARRGPASSSSGAPLQDPTIPSSQATRGESSLGKGSEGKTRVPSTQLRTAPAHNDSRPSAGPANSASNPAAPPADSTVVRSKATPVDKGNVDTSQKQPASLASTGPGGAAPYPKAPGESATATVENDVRDAFKQFASTEKMRLQERRRNQAKHDKDIKLNDLMKFSQNFKLVTPVPRDLVPILAKDKSKQEEIIERAQRNAKELNQGSPIPGHRPIATLVDPKTQKPLATTRPDSGSGAAQQATPSDRQGLMRRAGQPTPNTANAPPHRQQASQSGRQATNLGQRLTSMHNRALAAHSASPSPLPIGPAPITTHVPNHARYPGSQTPTSATSTQFNAQAIEFRPNPTAYVFTPTPVDPSGASSPRSNVNGKMESRVPTPSGFFGTKKPLPASERPSIDDYFNPIKRLRKQAVENKEDWTSNGGIRPAHKTGPRWDVAEANKEKTYTEMFDKISFSTQPISPQHPQYAGPQLTHQHQLPFNLQLGGAVIPNAPGPHHNPHHLHPQQPHHPPVGLPHQFDEHRLHISAAPSVIPSPRLQPVNVAYPSPMGQHAQLVYGQPVPQYGMGPVGPQMTPLRQFSSGSHFLSQHGGHMAAPMMAHSPSAGPLTTGMAQGFGGPFNQQMPVYSPQTVHAYPHHGGPPPPQPGSSGYPSPGRGAPMMIHQGSQPGQSAQQMMMFGMSPGQQNQHLYVPHPPGQVPVSRAGGYLPPQQPHYGVIPHGHHFPNHHRNAPNYNHAPPPPPANVTAQPAPPMGPDIEDEVK